MMRPGAARLFSRGILLIVLLAGLGACSATRIIPPSAPGDPAPVFILEHGGSSSLILSARDGSLHRYAYGDWAFYAERQVGSGRGLAALLWSTPAGLGRRQMAGPPTVASIYRQIRIGIDKLHVIEVERDSVDRLREQLDAMFLATTAHHPSPDVDLVFVPHPAAYHLLHNSNHVVADWLMQLGCEVSTRPVLSGWRIAE